MVDSRTLAYTFLERSMRRYYCVSSFRSDICWWMLSVSSKMTPGTNYFRSQRWDAYNVKLTFTVILQTGVIPKQGSIQIPPQSLKLEIPQSIGRPRSNPLHTIRARLPMGHKRLELSGDGHVTTFPS